MNYPDVVVDPLAWILALGPITGTDQGSLIVDLGRLAIAASAIFGLLGLIFVGVRRLGKILVTLSRWEDIPDRVDTIETRLDTWERRWQYIERRDQLVGGQRDDDAPGDLTT